MADLTLTTNLLQCGGNEYSNTLYTAVYMNIVSQNASTGVTTLHILIAGWAANTAGGGSTRYWSGVFRMYNGTSGDVPLIDGSFGPAYYGNYTKPVWVINQNYTILHTRSGGTWLAIKSYGVNVAWVTQKNGTVTHGHRWTTQGYSNCIIPAFNVASYTVKYNGNGNNGGTVPGNQTKYHNVALTLATNNLTHANSGATANGYKVTFHANGGSSTPAAITLTTYTIYTKNGWNTNSSGTGTHYNNGASYTGNAALTLYAQWSTSTGRNAIKLPAAISRANGSTTGYKVTFNANGGNSTPAAITSTRTIKYAFGGWNTNSSGTGSNYGAGTSYTPSAAITLYAKWTSSYVNNSITLPAAISRTGYTFGGWNTNSSGTGTNYNASSSYTPSAAITLYAKWTPINGKIYWHHGTAYDGQSGLYYGTAANNSNCNGLVSVNGLPGFAAKNSTALVSNWTVSTTAFDSWNTTSLFNAPTGCSHAAESKQWKIWNYTRGVWLNTTGVSAASFNVTSLVGVSGTLYGDTLFWFANWQRNNYTITTAVSPSGGGTVTGGGTYAYQASYTIKATAASGYRFTGWTYSNGWSGSNSNATVTGTMPAASGTATAHFILIFYLDVNGRLDGADVGNTSGYGTFDVTVGGTSRANDVADHYALYDKGSSYSISDIKATTGHVYLGVVAGATSGTINAATNIRLSFYSQTVWIYHNGWHRAIPWVYHGGSWHRALAKVYSGGWKNCKT